MFLALISSLPWAEDSTFLASQLHHHLWHSCGLTMCVGHQESLPCPLCQQSFPLSTFS